MSTIVFTKFLLQDIMNILHNVGLFSGSPLLCFRMRPETIWTLYRICGDIQSSSAILSCLWLHWILKDGKIFYKGDQANGSDIFNCGLKAWVDNFIGCCGRMYTDFFLLFDVSSPFFLTKRIDNNRRSGIQYIELVLLCVWMKKKNVVIFII